MYIPGTPGWGMKPNGFFVFALSFRMRNAIASTLSSLRVITQLRNIHVSRDSRVLEDRTPYRLRPRGS